MTDPVKVSPPRISADPMMDGDMMPPSYGRPQTPVAAQSTAALSPADQALKAFEASRNMGGRVVVTADMSTGKAVVTTTVEPNPDRDETPSYGWSRL